MVRTNILARDIGAESLVPIPFSIEYKTALFLLSAIPIFLGTPKDAQFERHIEPGSARLLVHPCPRNVVNAVSAIPDDAIDLIDTNLAAVFGLLSTPRDISAIVNCEHDRAVEAPISFVERDVYENGVGIGGQAPGPIASSRGKPTSSESPISCARWTLRRFARFWQPSGRR